MPWFDLPSAIAASTSRSRVLRRWKALGRPIAFRERTFEEDKPVAGRAPATNQMDNRRGPPAQVAIDEPIVTTALSGARAAGLPASLGGMDNWHDGATLILEAGIPTICFGPGDLHLAHTAAESVKITDLVACAQAIALTALRFCVTTSQR